MSQSQQNKQREFIAVDFRGVRAASRERTSMGIVGPATIVVAATLPGPLPELVERDPDADPRPTTIRSTATWYGVGGEGALAAGVYGSLGGLVRFAGTVGADPGGDLIQSWLSERGVDVQELRRAGSTPVQLHLDTSGYQPLTIAGDGHSGPTPEQAPAAFGEPGSTLFLAGYPYLGPMRGAGAAAVLEAARKRGLRTVVSLSPVALAGPGAPLSPSDLETVLPHTDLICGGTPELRRATRRTDLYEAARALIAAGAGAVLARRGVDGATVFRAGPASLDREDTGTPAVAAALANEPPGPYQVAAAFGAVFDAAYLLGSALNDASPVRFAAAAATRLLRSTSSFTP
jgi:sugar/nucleoside kinase (ribokinase family)